MNLECEGCNEWNKNHYVSISSQDLNLVSKAMFKYELIKAGVKVNKDISDVTKPIEIGESLIRNNFKGNTDGIYEIVVLMEFEGRVKEIGRYNLYFDLSISAANFSIDYWYIENEEYFMCKRFTIL